MNARLALSPSDAASMAEVVYAGLQSEDMTEFKQLSVGRIPNGYVPTGKLIKARTGVTRNSNFAVVMEREFNGGNHKVVSVRGTEFSSMNDWLTNFNVGVVPGPNTWPCHAGFFFAFQSMIQEIRKTVGNSPTTVHVCGHSLGGAMATLTALDLKNNGHDAHLYTFGAPRVGPLAFAQNTSKVLDGKIFRVFDRADPVPMIPLFPFIHAPIWSSSKEFMVGGKRNSIDTAYHSMADNYLKISKAAGSWNGMAQLADESSLDFGPAHWLEQAGKASHIPGAGLGLWALGKALEAILKVIVSTLQTGLSLVLTTVDLLAYALSEAVRISSEIKDWVLDWVRKALSWLGKKVATPAADITRSFLRYVLDLFFRALTNVARRALQMTKGRLR